MKSLLKRLDENARLTWWVSSGRWIFDIGIVALLAALAIIVVWCRA